MPHETWYTKCIFKNLSSLWRFFFLVGFKRRQHYVDDETCSRRELSIRHWYNHRPCRPIKVGHSPSCHLFVIRLVIGCRVGPAQASPGAAPPSLPRILTDTNRQRTAVAFYTMGKEISNKSSEMLQAVQLCRPSNKRVALTMRCQAFLKYWTLPYQSI